MGELAPQRSLVAAEAIERAIVEIGEAQEAAPDFSFARRIVDDHWIAPLAVLGRSIASREKIIPYCVGLNTTIEPNDGFENALRASRLICAPRLLDLTQDFALDLQHTSLDGCGATKPPQQACEPIFCYFSKSPFLLRRLRKGRRLDPRLNEQPAHHRSHQSKHQHAFGQARVR